MKEDLKGISRYDFVFASFRKIIVHQPQKIELKLCDCIKYLLHFDASEPYRDDLFAAFDVHSYCLTPSEVFGATQPPIVG